MYILDTNLYVEAARSHSFRAALRAFLVRAGPHVLASTVVIHELLVGANTKAAQDAVERDVAAPFQRFLRCIGTDALVWREAALITRAIAANKGHNEMLKSTSFRHDILIAASCRRVGATLITANRRDFTLIAEVRGLHFLTEFPT